MHGPLPIRQFVLPTLLILAGILAPIFGNNYFLFLGNQLMVYAVLALGLDLLIGRSGQFAFSHIAFFAMGAFGTVVFQTRLGLPYPVALLVAVGLAAATGALVALPSARMRSINLALATFAFGEAAQWVVNTWDSVTGGPNGLRIPAPMLFGLPSGTDASAFPVVAMVLAITILATQYLMRSRFGRALAAIRESEPIARTSGIDVRKTKVWAFVISAIYAAIAGGLLTLYQSFINAELFGFSQLVIVLTMVVVGGIGTIPGVLIGVVVIGLLPEVMTYAMRDILLFQEIVYGIILLAFMMFMPAGIWGVLQRRGEPRNPAEKPAIPTKESKGSLSQ